MFMKTLAAFAIAALVAIGALGATTAPAAAGYWGNGGNYDNYNAYPRAYPRDRPYPGIGRDYPRNNGYFNVRPRLYVPAQPVVQQVCKPVYRTVQVWKNYYGWVWATVYAGQQCWYQQVYPRQGYSNGW